MLAHVGPFGLRIPSIGQVLIYQLFGLALVMTADWFVASQILTASWGF